MARRRGYDLRRYVAEGLGTFALVAIGPGAVMVAAKTGAFGAQGVALAHEGSRVGVEGPIGPTSA